jgi:hypothetical protein
MNSKRTQGSGAEGQNQCKKFELNVPGTSPCCSLVLVIGQSHYACVCCTHPREACWAHKALPYGSGISQDPIL